MLTGCRMRTTIMSTECVLAITLFILPSVLSSLWSNVSNEHELPPSYGSNSTDVFARIVVDDIRASDVNRLEVEWIFYLTLRWNDSRIQHSKPTGSVTISGSDVNGVWRPDIYVSNSLVTRVFDAPRTNTAYRIYRNGSVVWRAKLSSTVRCPPVTHTLDTHLCTLKLQSFNFPVEHLKLRWETEKSPLVMNVDTYLRSFVRKESYHLSEKESIDTEEYSSLHACLLIKRVYKMYLVQVFMPSAMLVILSWLAFWIDRDAILARVSLGSLCVVSIITQSTGLMNIIPALSGIRAIEIWETTCITMIFLAMLEFACMHFMCRMQRKEDKYVRMSRHQDLDEIDDKKSKESDKDHIGLYTRLLRFKVNPERIDHFARILFPCSFLLFNIVYWSVYHSLG